MRLVGVALLLLALAGCGAPPDDDAVPEVETARPVSIDLEVADCTNAILFRLIPFSSTDAWLPPGFHARDAQGFIGAPFATNQGAAVLAVTKCARSSSGEPFEAAFAGVFVQSLEIAGITPAALEFYEVERLGPLDAVNQVLADAGWPVAEAHINVTSPGGPGQVVAEVSDAGGVLYQFDGVVVAPFTAQTPGIRLWNAPVSGLGYVQYDMPIKPVFGPGKCALRSASLFADLGETEDCLDHPAQVATYPDLAFEFHVRTFPGVVL